MKFLTREEALKVIRNRAAEACELEDSIGKLRRMPRGTRTAEVAPVCNANGYAYAYIEQCGPVIQITNRHHRPLAVGDTRTTREQILATLLRKFW